LTQDEIQSFHIKGTNLVSKTADAATAHLQMKSGLQAQISVSRVASLGQRSVRALCKDEILFANTGTLEIQKTSKGTGEEPVHFANWMVDKKDALQLELEAFVDCVANDKPPVVTGEDGMKALAWIEKLNHLIETQ